MFVGFIIIEMVKACSVKDCNKISRVLNLCQMHYGRYRRHGDVNKVLVNKTHDPICKLSDCKEKYYAHGYCFLHFGRWRRNGDPYIIKNIRNRKCSVNNCEKPHNANGYCTLHYNLDRKLQLFNILGGCFCKQCGFRDVRALQLDHIKGNGNKERVRFHSNSALIVYYLKHPEESKQKLQVLCANCNWIKRYDELNFIFKL